MVWDNRLYLSNCKVTQADNKCNNNCKCNNIPCLHLCCCSCRLLARSYSLWQLHKINRRDASGTSRILVTPYFKTPPWRSAAAAAAGATSRGSHCARTRVSCILLPRIACLSMQQPESQPSDATADAMQQTTNAKDAATNEPPPCAQQSPFDTAVFVHPASLQFLPPPWDQHTPRDLARLSHPSTVHLVDPPAFTQASMHRVSG